MHSYIKFPSLYTEQRLEYFLKTKIRVVWTRSPWASFVGFTYPYQNNKRKEIGVFRSGSIHARGTLEKKQSTNYFHNKLVLTTGHLNRLASETCLILE